MLDLFDSPVLPGIVTIADIVTTTEEAALISAIDAEPLSATAGRRSGKLIPPVGRL